MNYMINNKLKQIPNEVQNMPKNWISTCMMNVCNTSSGGTPSRKRSEYYDCDIFWLKSGELNNSIILNTTEKFHDLD